MNKTCARCEKTVYPTEELKCLDKAWHKGCFKCQECGMTLNMRTYKGYGKLPYCEAHVPKAKHTTMAETPELKRIAENTKLQSNVKYHADFEKSKGKFTQVADDPETLRIKANTKIISNVAYHGELEKKAQMEKQRQINENGELVGSHHQQQPAQSTRQIGRVADLDPLGSERAAYAGPDQNYMQVMSNKHEPEVQKVYIAMYDYEANDSDEVSFREGDLISNVTAIDEGWMTGRVLRTGRTGMLPANYVERAPPGTYTH
ncbi:LIM and SH3 domain protein Lasp isoform X2 [Cydia pomonella]|uniref:LIM and SH3 domain protein Lasp isoform X2 n=1 Tax=Cydia pomonella TaxID=82600 RepID=UPI002ADE3DCC|nr:LIM and SH3 domain protein Lasp isoform X2 [Cydia pomonella]